MIAEHRDRCVYNGGHMNIGEARRHKDYVEIISTYWMERILSNHAQ